LKLPADDRKSSVNCLAASMRLSAGPMSIAAATSSTMDKSACGIAHPERSGALF
jgi:hypothetical protein